MATLETIALVKYFSACVIRCRVECVYPAGFIPDTDCHRNRKTNAPRGGESLWAGVVKNDVFAPTSILPFSIPIYLQEALAPLRNMGVGFDGYTHRQTGARASKMAIFGQFLGRGGSHHTEQNASGNVRRTE